VQAQRSLEPSCYFGGMVAIALRLKSGGGNHMSGFSAGTRTMVETAAELQKYKELVDRCARDRLDFPIPNGSPSHARILIAKLFETAQSEVCILSGQLTDVTKLGIPIYGHEDVLDNARQFLRQVGSNLHIVVQKPVHHGDNNQLLRCVIEDHDRKGEVVLYHCDKQTNNTDPPHFMVTDALAFRFETGDTKITLDSADAPVTAIANFGDGKSAKTLRKGFRAIAEHLSEKRREHRFPPGAKFQTV
jgi:hypothetical protein